MREADLLNLIHRLYWCLVNHPPAPEMFKERTRLLSEAHELVRHMDVEEPYVIPSEE